jgi:hypothetical protein
LADGFIHASASGFSLAIGCALNLNVKGSSPPKGGWVNLPLTLALFFNKLIPL